MEDLYPEYCKKTQNNKKQNKISWRLVEPNIEYKTVKESFAKPLSLQVTVCIPKAIPTEEQR